MLISRIDYSSLQDPKGIFALDEPIFIARAKDIDAPTIVAIASLLYASRGCDAPMVDQCRYWAQKMRDWQIANSAKMADVPEQMLAW